MSILWALLVLGFLILVHEFGHFIFAKYFGVGVKRFSIGFGPKLLSKKIRETEYVLSLLPLGGYVSMVGEDEEGERDLENSFRSRHVFKRILIVFAGPFFNLLSGFVFIAAVYTLYGIPVLTNNIGGVAVNSPAEKIGIAAGDKVIAINGTPINSWDEITRIMSKYHGGGLIKVVIMRGGVLREIQIQPELIEDKNIFGEVVKRYVIGINPDQPVIERGVQKAITKSAKTTANVTSLTVLGVWKLIRGQLSRDNIGGPILITQTAGAAASMGFDAFLRFAGFISLSLFVANLLPIPALDGGHIFLFFVEWIRGKPLNKKAEETIQKIGTVLILWLMLFATYNDILRFFK